MSLYLHTTGISAGKSAGEISTMLADAGAHLIQMEYTNGQTTGLTFFLQVQEQEIPFKLPIRTGALLAVLQRQRSPRTRERMLDSDAAQAERIAWRQVCAWVRAQLALIETGMVQPVEVFMPYVRLASGMTWFERLEATKFKALPAPAADGAVKA